MRKPKYSYYAQLDWWIIYTMFYSSGAINTELQNNYSVPPYPPIPSPSWTSTYLTRATSCAFFKKHSGAAEPRARDWGIVILSALLPLLLGGFKVFFTRVFFDTKDRQNCPMSNALCKSTKERERERESKRSDWKLCNLCRTQVTQINTCFSIYFMHYMTCRILQLTTICSILHVELTSDDSAWSADHRIWPAYRCRSSRTPMSSSPASICVCAGVWNRFRNQRYTSSLALHWCPCWSFCCCCRRRWMD